MTASSHAGISPTRRVGPDEKDRRHQCRRGEFHPSGVTHWTRNKPLIFAFHANSWNIVRLICRRIYKKEAAPFTMAE